MQTSLLFEKKSEVKGVSITPSRSQLLIQWARSGLPASLPFESEIDTDHHQDDANDDCRNGRMNRCPETRGLVANQ